MSTIRRFGLGILSLTVLLSMLGCYKWKSSATPDQFDPPPNIFPDQVGAMVLERKWDKNPVCIRDGAVVTCIGFYVDPAADPDVSRISHSVDIFEAPAQAAARLDALATEKFMDEDVFTWETVPKNGGKLLVRSGFRHDGEGTIGSCSLSYTNESVLIRITHGFSCEAAREFVNGLLAQGS